LPWSVLDTRWLCVHNPFRNTQCVACTDHEFEASYLHYWSSHRNGNVEYDVGVGVPACATEQEPRTMQGFCCGALLGNSRERNHSFLPDFRFMFCNFHGPLPLFDGVRRCILSTFDIAWLSGSGSLLCLAVWIP
jgi:hypothetical protein